MRIVNWETRLVRIPLSVHTHLGEQIKTWNTLAPGLSWKINLKVEQGRINYFGLHADHGFIFVVYFLIKDSSLVT